MTMPSTRLFGHNLEYVTELILALHFHFFDWLLTFGFSQNQKKRVAEEEAVSRKRGLNIRLLPPAEEDVASAAHVKFSAKFDRNRKDKRALINAASIFSGSSGSSTSAKRQLGLESKRRRISAAAASNILAGGFKPSSWSQSAVTSRRHRGS
jgi:coiled-coil domain-containing protein 130